MRATVQSARGGRTKTVRDIMRHHVVSVVPEMTVRELVQTFLEEHVRGAPVLGPTGKVIGLVSETDVLRAMLPTHANGNGNGAAPADADRVCVGDIMGPVPFVFSPGDAVSRVAHTFAADGVQRVVVIENDILLGIVTPADLMRTLDGAAAC
ncbi:MAG TPA: CBS domain-containing protein [Longimicrobiaceae bacterium]|nr:CBS domain-containing protein [Longimicrobiaceae bacterium]